MRLRRIQLLASLAGVLAFAACTLNPQPLPPSDLDNGATALPDGGGFGRNTDSAAEPVPADNAADAAGSFDAAPTPPQDDAGADADADAGADAGPDGN